MNLFSDEMSRRDSTDPMVGSSELSTCSPAGQLPRIGLWTYANLVLIRVLIWACLLHPIITNFNESLITLTVLKSHSNLVSLADRCFVLHDFFFQCSCMLLTKTSKICLREAFFPSSSEYLA